MVYLSLARQSDLVIKIPEFILYFLDIVSWQTLQLKYCLFRDMFQACLDDNPFICSRVSSHFFYCSKRAVTKI